MSLTSLALTPWEKSAMRHGLNGISHGPEGSVDKLLMTWTEQSVGHATLAIGAIAHGSGDDTSLNVYSQAARRRSSAISWPAEFLGLPHS